jgi:hypothetical protein
MSGDPRRIRAGKIGFRLPPSGTEADHGSFRDRIRWVDDRRLFNEPPAILYNILDFIPRITK